MTTPTQGAELVARPVDCDVICLTCGKRYGDHYGPFCDHSEEERLHGNRAFMPALRSPGQQAGEPSEWQPVETRPKGLEATYLVANAAGQVAPLIRGVIHNNTGTANDWSYGENVTHWMPLPKAPARVSIDIREGAA